MTTLPSGWAIASLDEISEINPRHPRELEDSLPVTFVRMPALSETDWKFEFTEERPLGQVRKGFTHFAEGDVLFAKITPCMENGKAAVASHLLSGLGCGTTELHVLRPRGGINPKYIYHFIHRDSFREEAARNFTGSAGQLRVPVDFIRDTQIPLAPLNEQRRIVVKLEKLLSRVDAAQVRLATIPRILKRFRRSVLAAATLGELTTDWRVSQASQRILSMEDILKARKMTWEANEIKRGSRGAASDKRNGRKYVEPVGRDESEDFEPPEKWIAVSADQVTSLITDGKHGDCRNEAQSGYFFLSVKDLYRGNLHYENARQIRKEDFLEVDYRTNLEVGDVLVTNAGTIGRVAIARETDRVRRTTFQKSVAVIKPVRAVIVSEYLAIYIESAVHDLQHKSSGTAVNNLLLRDLKKMTVALPPVSEQKEIVRRVEALFKAAEALEARYRTAKAHVDKLTQSILAKAFRGELVPQDPNDEPASQLLERIQRKQQIARNLTDRRAQS